MTMNDADWKTAFDDRMRRAAEAWAQWRETRAELTGQVGFRPVSLSDWLDLCARAGVPTVPAMLIGEAPVDSLFQEPDGDDMRAAELFAAHRDMVDTLGPGWMARWDCCSMADIKMAMSDGTPTWHPNFFNLYADDFRAADLLMDFPADTVKAWARPWMDFDRWGGWPVEYRVYVQDNRIIGVSNYYPQRSLTEWRHAETDVDTCMTLTNMLIEAQRLEIICPELQSDFDRSRNHWTADFARLPSGAILFLEGGPPYTPVWGAHPCCFEGREISGVALELAQ